MSLEGLAPNLQMTYVSAKRVQSVTDQISSHQITMANIWVDGSCFLSGSMGIGIYAVLNFDVWPGCACIEISEYLWGKGNNHIAEYFALYRALQISGLCECKTKIYTDSQLVFGHINDLFQPNDSTFSFLLKETRNLIEKNQVELRWVNRFYNIEADELSRKALMKGKTRWPRKSA